MKAETCKKFSFIVLVVCCISLYLVLLNQIYDNDIFFEIASGRDLLQGNFSTASHLSNLPIIVQQWLYSVCLAIAEKGGVIGITAFVVLQHILLCTISSIFIYRKTKNIKYAIFGSFFTLVFCHNYMINARPQIITVILLIAQLLLLDIYKEKNKIGYLFAIIPILLLEANFHQAVFLYHLVVMIPFFIDKKENKYKTDWKLFAFVPLYLVCSLATPYGINGSLYVFKTFGTDIYQQITIEELEPIKILSYIGIKLILLILILLYTLCKRSIDKYTCFFIVLLAGLSIMSARNISIAFIPIMYILANIDLSKAKNMYVYGCLSLCCIGICLIKIATPNQLAEYFNPTEIIPNHDAKICNIDINSGGWLEYNDYVNVKYDCRTEIFTKELCGIDNYYSDYFILKSGKDSNGNLVSNETVLNTVNKYDYIIAPKNSYVIRVIDWNNVYENDNIIIFEK